MQRKAGTKSDTWICSKKSKSFGTLFNSQDFEKVDSLNASLDDGKIMSFLIPQEEADNGDINMRRDETYLEKIINMGTNLRFTLETIGESLWADDSKKKKAYLLGQEYEPEKLDDLKRMRKDFSKVLWFSYRKNFPMLNYKLLPQSESFISDTGWGCMIRVCQMIFAECLKRHCNARKAHLEEKQATECSGSSLNKINQDYDALNYEVASWFLDSEVDHKVAPYSIQNLSMRLQERFKLKPGIWLKPSSVLFAMQEIHQDFGREVAPGLQMEIYIESTIYVTQALKKVTCLDTSSDNSFDRAFAQEFELVEMKSEEENEEECCEAAIKPSGEIREDKEESHNKEDDHKDQNIDQLYLNDAREIEKLLKHKWKDSLVVFMLAKIGLDKPNPQYVPFIKDLLSYPESVGMIGGKPGLAYYIVGYIEDKLIYLDPHFVQESVRNKESLKENMHTYFASSIKHIGFNDIDTSVTLGFFIEDEKSFKAFIERFTYSCNRNESFLGIELNGPRENTTDVESVCEDDLDNDKSKDEDGFEML